MLTFTQEVLLSGQCTHTSDRESSSFVPPSNDFGDLFKSLDTAHTCGSSGTFSMNLRTDISTSMRFASFDSGGSVDGGLGGGSPGATGLGRLLIALSKTSRILA